MKLDRFLISYNGNKYLETKKYISHLLKDDYDYIIEPFGGIFGFSRAHFEKYPESKTKYIICDLNKDHINLLKFIKDEYNTEDIIKFINEQNITDDITLRQWLKNNDNHKYFNLLRSISRGLNSQINFCDIQKMNAKIKNFKILENEYKSFFNKVEFYNYEFNECLENLKYENKKVLYYLDPPYFDSSNSEYSNAYGFKVITKDNVEYKYYNDSTKIYIDILNFMKSTKQKYILVINGLSILNHIYEPYFLTNYERTYQNTTPTQYGTTPKKRQVHMVYSNLK